MARYAAIFHEGEVLAEGGSAVGEFAASMVPAVAGMPEAASFASVGCGRQFALFQRDRGCRATVYSVCASQPLRKDEARSLLALLELLLASWQAKAEGGTAAHLAAEPALLESLQAALDDTLLPFCRQGNASGEPPVYPRVHFQRPRAQQVDEVAPPPGAGAEWGAGAEGDAAEVAWEMEEKRRRRERNLAVQSMRSKSGIPAVHLPPGDLPAAFDSDASAASARALGMSMPFSRMAEHGAHYTDPPFSRTPQVSRVLGTPGETPTSGAQIGLSRPEAPQASLGEPGRGLSRGSAPGTERGSDMVPDLPSAGPGVSPASAFGAPGEAPPQEGGSELRRGGGGSSRVLRTSSSEGPERQRSGCTLARGTASPDVGRPVGMPPLPRSAHPCPPLSPASWQAQPSPTGRARGEAESSGRLTPRERLLLEIAEMQGEVEWQRSASTSTGSSLESPSALLPISDSAPTLTPCSRAASDRGSPGLGFGGGATRGSGGGGSSRKARGMPKPHFSSRTPTGREGLRRSVTASVERVRETPPTGAGSAHGGEPPDAVGAQEADAVNWNALRSWTFTSTGARERQLQALADADGASRQTREQADLDPAERREVGGMPHVQSWNSLALVPSGPLPGPQAGGGVPAGIRPQRRSFGLLRARQVLAPASAGAGLLTGATDAVGGAAGFERRAQEGPEEAGQPFGVPSTASQDMTVPTAPRTGGAPGDHPSIADLVEGASDTPRPTSPGAGLAPVSVGCLPSLGARAPSSRIEAPGSASAMQGGQEGCAQQAEAVVVLQMAELERGAGESSNLTEWEAYLGTALTTERATTPAVVQQGAGARAGTRPATGQTQGKGELETAGSEGAAPRLHSQDKHQSQSQLPHPSQSQSQSESRSRVGEAGGEPQSGRLAMIGEETPGKPGAGAGTQRWRTLFHARGSLRQPAGAVEETVAEREGSGARRSFTLLPSASRDSNAKGFAQPTSEAQARRRRSFATVRGEVRQPVEEAARPEAPGAAEVNEGDVGEGGGHAAMPRGKGKGSALSQLLHSAGVLFERKGAKDRREERLVV